MQVSNLQVICFEVALLQAYPQPILERFFMQNAHKFFLTNLKLMMRLQILLHFFHFRHHFFWNYGTISSINFW